MKKINIKIILLIVVIIISAIFLIKYFNKRYQEKIKIERKFDFPKTISINNTTHYKNYDTTLMIIINKIFKHDTIHLDVYYVNNFLINDKFDIKAHIIKHYFIPHTYMLFLNKNLNDMEILTILTHEMIHLHQYETNTLKISTESDYYIYDNDTNRMIDVPYLDRLYEIDAYQLTEEIMRKYLEIIK